MSKTIENPCFHINVNDDFYCKYYERGDDNGKS